MGSPLQSAAFSLKGLKKECDFIGKWPLGDMFTLSISVIFLRRRQAYVEAV
jgi:hypothetical protein